MQFKKEENTSKNNFHNISKINKCEQRWSLENVLTKNASASRYKTYIETCDELDIETQVKLIEEKLVHKRQLPNLKRHGTPDFRTIEKQKSSIIGSTNLNNYKTEVLLTCYYNLCYQCIAKQEIESLLSIKHKNNVTEKHNFIKST